MASDNPVIGIYQNQPTNENFLITNRFRVILRRAPNIVFWVQQCNLPGFSMGNPAQPTPLIDIPWPGDKMQYSDFTITFKVDEDMRNYREIEEWVKGLGFPKEFGQAKDLYNSLDGPESEINLVILDSAQQPKHIVTFRDCFPVSISDITFDTTNTDTVIPMVTATFKYTLWEMETIAGEPEMNADSTTITQADLENI